MKLSITLILSTLVWYAHAQSSSQKTTRSYCTNVGPVEINIDGETATGRYLLTVTPDLKKGILKGTYSKGLFEGTWDDPDGIGRIIIGFNPDMTKFIAMYNTSKDASHWYNEWKGYAKEIYPQLKAEEKKNLECNWK